MNRIDTLIEDIYTLASHGIEVKQQGEWSDKAIVEYATRSGEFMGKKVYPEDRGVKDYADHTIRMSELGTPCLRQLMLKWYHPEYGLPPYTYTPDPTLGVKFGYGTLIEEFVLTLAECAGHLVSDRQAKVELTLPGFPWKAAGSIDALVDGTLVDVKSTSKFAFDKYRKEGFTETNDTFGYSYQLNGYKCGLVEGGYKISEANFLMVEKETGRIQIVPPLPMKRADVEERIRTVAKAAEMYQRTGTLPSPLPVKTHTYGKALDVACSYCQFKHACFPNIKTFVDKGRPVHLVALSTEGERLVKLRPKDFWRSPPEKPPTVT